MTPPLRNATLVTNVGPAYWASLGPAIRDAAETRFAVAFFKYSGYKVMESDLLASLSGGGKTEFIVGFDFANTEPKALTSLLGLRATGLNIKLFGFRDPQTETGPVFHPKLYFAKRGERVTLGIGSSNLTKGGLSKNVEANVILSVGADDEIVSDVLGYYNLLKFQSGCFEPDQDYIEAYSTLYQRLLRGQRSLVRRETPVSVLGEFAERERALRRPSLTPQDLFGWMKLVYLKLPDARFFAKDLYQYEAEFQTAYPTNRHIKAKIRQQLQYLRDLGLVRQVSTNEWEKV